MRRLGAWLVGFVVAVAAAVMAAAPEPSARVQDVPTSAAPARNPERPRNMAAAIALVEQIRP